ncbi:MAG: cytochrome c biogenesis protein ResB [Pyrinomonadaceae bacterium]|nr:cytochrome c biogenesis protein ResB [Pyrinomonadaceae bacterium]
MSASPETKNSLLIKSSPARTTLDLWLTSALDLLSSVRFGITLLVLLVFLSMTGMLIMQQEIDGFDKYYAALTPSQKLVYGALGLFDVYHTWYFNLFLIVLSLNIVLASIDRFPKAWTFIRRPKLDASPKYLRGQKPSATFMIRANDQAHAAQSISAAAQAAGYKTRITEKAGSTFVFAERGAWNRLGAYAVHVALLTIFLGGFLTFHFGRTGNMSLKPGASSSQMFISVFELDQQKRAALNLPFTVACTDIQQKLIRKEGTIQPSNTIDWLTRIRIKDERGERDAIVNLNNPYDYRGYRFFQASYDPTGNARSITLHLTPQTGGAPQDVTLQRNNQATTLADGTKIQFVDFSPDFRIAGGRITTASQEYNNPAAILSLTTPAGEQLRAYAFSSPLPDNAPVGAPVGGYKFRLTDFEKAPLAHVLSIKYDPFYGSTIFYIGGALLILTLCAVFFFSHERIWAHIEAHEAGAHEVILGGNTNRNQTGLEERFRKLLSSLNGTHNLEVKQS